MLAAAAAAATTEPDEALVQALYKMGISSNRARRACVATRNASREAALAWCVEHAADPAMDAPFVSSSRPAGAGNGGSSGSGGGSTSGGGDGVAGQHRGDEMRAAARHRSVAAAALEAYVRARLSTVAGSGGRDGVSGGGGGGGGVDVGGVRDGGVPSDETEELMAVLTSFRKRQSLGQAEDKARAILPATVDLGMFVEDQRYRQVGVRPCGQWCSMGCHFWCRGFCTRNTIELFPLLSLEVLVLRKYWQPLLIKCVL